MRRSAWLILMIALSGCATAPDPIGRPQKAVVGSEAARQKAAKAAASGDSADEALQKAAASPTPQPEP